MTQIRLKSALLSFQIFFRLVLCSARTPAAGATFPLAFALCE